jgi:hypothetical protein
MKGKKLNYVLVVAVLFGTVLYFWKDSETRQKWAFMLKEKQNSRKFLAEQRSIARNGGVLLDDIELAAYHN